MSLFTEIFNEQIMNALGWTIFHILWQGFIVALLLGISLRFLKHKSAQLRYLVSFVSLFSLLVLAIYNFNTNYKDYSKLNWQETSIKNANPADFSMMEFGPVNEHLFSTIRFTSIKTKIRKLDKYFPYMVNIWIFGLFIFAIKFVLSYLYTSRLKKIKAQDLSANWLHRFKNIERTLALSKPVRYIESSLIKIPLVLGYFKPVVVIPIEILTGIPVNQLEAIIAHELAHIQREDYLFNVMQTIIETVFFFHPAVWYMSSHIRNERENCCDDIALSVCKESLVYAKALVSIQELTLNRHYSAVAFSGRKKHLLNRIKRMIMKPKNKSNFTDKVMAALIILSSVLALSFTNTADLTNYSSESGISNDVIKTMEAHVSTKAPVNQIAAVKYPETIKDSLKVRNRHHDEIDIENNTITRSYVDQGDHKKMKFTLKNGKVSELYVDGKKIPERDHPKYQAEIDETIHDLKDAKMDIRKAMKEIKELDIEKIQMEVQEAMKDIHVDISEIHEEVAKAMEEIHEIDMDDVMNEVERSIRHLDDLDLDFDFDFDHDFNIQIGDVDIDVDEIREELERARESIRENVDMEAIQKEMQQVQEELSKVDHEKIRMQIEEGVKSFEMHDKEKVMKNLEEKLEELEKLELEEK